MIRSSVDFPQPDGPISETNSRGRTSRSMSWSAVTPVRNDFVRPRTETTLAAGEARTWLDAQTLMPVVYSYPELFPGADPVPARTVFIHGYNIAERVEPPGESCA